MTDPLTSLVERLEKAEDIQAVLDAVAAIDPPYPHWIEGNPDAEIECYDYCLSCAEKKASTLDGARVVGYGCASERDGCCHCATCGCILDYMLTKHGVLEELSHFERNPPQAPLSADEAFHIARMVEGIDELDEDAHKAAVLRVAETAASLRARQQGEG